MQHRVNNVEELYDCAMVLYKNVVIGADFSADSILYNLNQGIENLKMNWKGIDAGLRIQELINVYNKMIVVRNSLAKLAIVTSKTASNYRDIQITNGGKYDQLLVLRDEQKTMLGEYTDTNDMISINASAVDGKKFIDIANYSIDTFAVMARYKHDEIIENWISGSGRDIVLEAYDDFFNNLNHYKYILHNVSQNIDKALQNYVFN